MVDAKRVNQPAVLLRASRAMGRPRNPTIGLIKTASAVRVGCRAGRIPRPGRGSSMRTHAADHHTWVEERTNFYLQRRRQIDSILEKPVKTLVRVAKQSANGGRIQIPVWISSDSDFTEGSSAVESESKNSLAQWLCCDALGKLNRLRRRFAWLDKKTLKSLGELEPSLTAGLAPGPDAKFADYVDIFRSESLGTLNPITASQIFRLLLNSRDELATNGTAFLAFFAMVWSIYKGLPEELSHGSVIEPWRPTAFATAYCLLPIKKIQEVAEHRADLFARTKENIEVLFNNKPPKCHSPVSSNKSSPEPSPRWTERSHWKFNLALDDLSANLFRLSRVLTKGEKFRECAKIFAKASDEMSLGHPNRGVRMAPWLTTNIAETYGSAYPPERLEEILKNSQKPTSRADVLFKILTRLAEELIGWGQEYGVVLADARKVIRDIGSELIPRLNSSGHVALKEWGLRFDEERKEDGQYFRCLRTAAREARKLCKKASDNLGVGKDACKQIRGPAYRRLHGKYGKTEAPGSKPPAPVTDKDESDLESLRTDVTGALETLRSTNTELAKSLEKAVMLSARWCRHIVSREVSYASAQSDTDFDVGELVSAIGVAVRWDLVTTPAQVASAVKSALYGERRDGSWRATQPFYSADNVFGLRASSSEIVWMLTSGIQKYPEVDIADEALFRYVDWLESRQAEITWAGESATGWGSDRLAQKHGIHLPTTAFSINALIEIRDLVEYRMWQICEKRFTVIPAKDGLDGVAPVDLGAKHGSRLHGRLAKMARGAQGDEYKDAEYSLVLHGPPGSSKTTLARALAAEMWKSSRKWGDSDPRLVRVTPADFTRLGEDRLDSEARIIFDLLSGVRGITILFDEIDDLLRVRSPGKGSPQFIDLVVPAMLNRLADLRDSCPSQEICFLLATNYIENIDPALIRRGRIDSSLPVVYPDWDSRVLIALERLASKGKIISQPADLESSLAREIARNTWGWPWGLIDAVCKLINKELGNPPISGSDWQSVVDRAIRSIQPSISRPSYVGRWEGRFSPELLQEYFHFALCGLAPYGGGSDFPRVERAVLREAAARSGRKEVDLFLEFLELLSEQGRLGRIQPSDT